jgi:endoglucanase
MPIYVNQNGYSRNSIKHATISGANCYTLYNSNNEAVLEGTADNLKFDKNSGENVAVIDFTEVCDCGSYYFMTSDGTKSCSFLVSDSIYDKILFDSCKMFYYQRCGIELEEKYAGIYGHKACHTDKVSVLKDSSKVFECCGGWHDAGDFGRYVTAGAVAVAHLLYAYEVSPEAFNMILNIPESGNGIPDILNEVRYELEWFLKMQTEDGGVYHKCTSMHHADFVMPEEDKLPFVVTPVTSLATADFAGACALAARIYKPFDGDFAEKLEAAAIKAFEWLIKNPGYLFDNPKECTTGTYDDPCDVDERLWASAEIYRLTGDERALGILSNLAFNTKVNVTALGWCDVGGLAALSVLTGSEEIYPADLYSYFYTGWMEEAERLYTIASKNGFELSFHPFNFGWGSNMGVLLNSIILSFAHKLSGKEKYLNAAITQIDYILGRNALNTSYVTGYGEKSFKNPHNRPTYADGIDEPIPGFVSGGPNRHPCDPDAIRLIPSGSAPMKCYADHWGSYSTNEITIYWNSPLVFTLAYLKVTL